jgi:hypothetical protein
LFRANIAEASSVDIDKFPISSQIHKLSRQSLASLSIQTPSIEPIAAK